MIRTIHLPASKWKVRGPIIFAFSGSSCFLTASTSYGEDFASHLVRCSHPDVGIHPPVQSDFASAGFTGQNWPSLNGHERRLHHISLI